MTEESLKLDYTIDSPEERVKLTEKIIKNTPPEKLTPKYLEIMADYIIFAMDRKERRERKILTENRMVTINKRETSFEGLISKFENGEDGIYNMMTNDKNIIFTPKISITPRDIEEVPGLKQIRTAIEQLEERMKKATGRDRYIIKKNIIDLRKDQYILKNSYYQPMQKKNITRTFFEIPLKESITITKEQGLNIEGFSLLISKHVSILLCNYLKLKQSSWNRLNSDIRWVLIDLENLITKHLKYKYPMYYDLMLYKISGNTNEEIQIKLIEDYDTKHSLEYISSLWRNKIPKIIADGASQDWLEWYYSFQEYGKWKRCSRCGQIKLAHNTFFSKNNTSKDGFYSICKECRNAKTKKNKQQKKVKK